MMRRINIKELFQNRKTLYFTLCIILISVLSLTIVYAALSVTLNITGSSEVTASNWNIRLANPEVKSGSVSANAPSISGNNLSFDVELNIPGEYYEFTVDVVNDGSIDAMIDSVVKTPELTTEQAKYIKYEITYENGESINTNQTIKSGPSTPIKVRIEYRTDISSTDLPSSTTVLNLILSLIYVQSDGSGSSIPNNGIPNPIVIMSGDGTQVGNEVCIKEECFYVISSTDTTVTMLSQMNVTLEENPKQSLDAGTLAFSSRAYWAGAISSYPTYIYDSNSNLYPYVVNYKNYLETLGISLIESRLITYQELIKLGCSDLNYPYTCTSSVNDWVYEVAYWGGTASSDSAVWRVDGEAYIDFGSYIYSEKNTFGVRLVITISRDYL